MSDETHNLIRSQHVDNAVQVGVVQDQAGVHYLCNATGDAMIWAFEPIGDPLKFETQTS